MSRQTKLQLFKEYSQLLIWQKNTTDPRAFTIPNFPWQGFCQSCWLWLEELSPAANDKFWTHRVPAMAMSGEDWAPGKHSPDKMVAWWGVLGIKDVRSIGRRHDSHSTSCAICRASWGDAVLYSFSEHPILRPMVEDTVHIFPGERSQIPCLDLRSCCVLFLFMSSFTRCSFIV
jgi:hypothetical protein